MEWTKEWWTYYSTVAAWTRLTIEVTATAAERREEAKEGMVRTKVGSKDNWREW